MRILIRHFFDRFLDKESLSPQGEPEANLTQALGFLAVPGAFLIILMQPLLFWQWTVVMARCFFVSFSMIVMGFLVVFEWDALFPDRRDYQVLTPLPVGLWTIFLAKVAAFGLFLGVFLVDINFFSALMWTGVENKATLLGAIGLHLMTVVLSGLFAALSLACIQGVLITLLPATAFRRVSVWLQTVLMGALVMMLFLIPRLVSLIEGLSKTRSPWAYAFPGYWFAGMYEQFRPMVGNQFLMHLGEVAWWGLAGAGALFLLTYLPGYRRHARKVLEAPQPNPSGPSALQRSISRLIGRSILRAPVQIAVFQFVNQTITRSMKHRLFLATYAGCGGALAVATFGSGSAGMLRLPLTLSFILVSALRAAFNFPSELGANWAFQVSENHHVRDTLSATRKWIVLCATGPLFLLLAPLEFWYFPWPAAVFHLAYGFVLSLVLMEVMFLGFRKAPFTCAYLPGKVNLVFLSVIYIFGFTLYSRLMADLEEWLQAQPAAGPGFLAAAAAAFVLLNRWRARHVEEAAVLEYEDQVEPEVRTLELSA